MSHQYDLYERVKAMLSQRYLNDSPEVRELESGDIVVCADIGIETDVGNRSLDVTMQFRCKKSGIVSRAILKLIVPPHAHKRVVNLITQINGSKRFSCLEFDYRDGEIAARNFLQCMDYVPSIDTIFTMISDANSKFIEHGDQLIEAIGINPNPSKHAAQPLDVLDEALKGDATSQGVLLDLISRDPESDYSRRLMEAANSGNPLAQALLRQCMKAQPSSGERSGSTNGGIPQGSRDPAQYGYDSAGLPRNKVWPALPSKNDLAARTAAAYAKYLNSGVDILNKNDLIDSSHMLGAALNGDANQCFFIAENFGSDSWPENANPQLAFCWAAYRQTQISALDDQYTVNNAIAVFQEAYYLVLFGNEAQKISAVQAMDACAEMFCVRNGSWVWFIVHKYISLIAGVHPEEVFRKPQYDYSSVVNRERGIRLYKKLINLMIEAGDPNAEEYADELEGILGIQYYEDRVESQFSNAGRTSSAENRAGGRCYVATCVYGSYDCPQVWTLRRYRDRVLAEHELGKLFIRFYYAVSPHLVKAFGGCPPVRGFWKMLLDRMVRALNEKGYEDTPYED